MCSRIRVLLCLVCCHAIRWSGVSIADEILEFSHQGIERTAAIHQPASTSGHAAPVVIVLHGLGDSGPGFEKWAGVDAVADRESFVAVYPDAVEGR
jgi:polyhydroxybutyrate depolymerase